MRNRNALLLGTLRGLSAVTVFWFFGLPVLIVVLSAFSADWLATVFPTSFTLRWFTQLDETDLQAVMTSFEVAGIVAMVGTGMGVWLALSLQRLEGRWLWGVLDALVMLPTSLPGVVLGLGVLLAYHRSPVDLSDSLAIVIIVQLGLVVPFCYRMNVAALKQDIPVLREAAASLGASPAMVLAKVVIPMLEPSIRASIALALAVSLGDLGATLMVAPPSLRTVPIVVMANVERGYYYQASGLALILLAVSLIALVLVAGRRGRVSAADAAGER